MTNKDEVTLSIVIPAYKEQDIIRDNLVKLGTYLQEIAPRLPGDYEVIVAVNSPDKTAERAAEAAPSVRNLRVIDETRRLGKGGAVRLGIFEARGSLILFMDADLSTPLHHIEALIALLDRADIAIGVRQLALMHKTFLRRHISRVANTGVQLLVAPGISDTQCGFKAMHTKAARDIFERMQVTSWSFDVEMLAIARKLGYSIAQHRIDDWLDPKIIGLGGDSPMRAALREALVLLKIKFSLLKREYTHIHYVHQPKDVPYRIK